MIVLEDLETPLTLLVAHPALGPFDAVLAAVAMRTPMGAIVSAERAFGTVPGVRHIDPADAVAMTALLGREAE